MQTNGPRRWALFPVVAFFACTDKDDGPSGSAGAGTTEADTGAAPLDNGPGGGLVMVRACAPNDAPAYSLLIGLGDRCDMEPPAATAPYVQLVPFETSFMQRPVDNELAWTNSEGAAATFAPEGRNAPTYNPSAGALYLSEWEGVDDGMPVGGAVSGWYTLTLDDGYVIGASFSGAWCGGDPVCG